MDPLIDRRLHRVLLRHSYYRSELERPGVLPLEGSDQRCLGMTPEQLLVEGDERIRSPLPGKVEPVEPGDETVGGGPCARALLNFNIEEYQGAVDDLAAYAAVGGDDPAAAQFRRGIALIALGKFEEARGELETALGQDPSVANRVVKGISDVVDGAEHLLLQDEVPSDLLEMLKPRE